MVDVLFPCLRVRADGALSEKATGQAVSVYVCHALKWTKMWCLGRIMKPPTVSNEFRRPKCSRITS